MRALLALGMASLLAAPAAAADSINRKAEALLWYDAFDANKPALLDKILDQAWVDIPSPPNERAGPEAAARSPYPHKLGEAGNRAASSLVPVPEQLDE